MWKIGLAQGNFCVGAVEATTQKILEKMEEAKAAAVTLLAFPELSVTAYPPEDLLFYPELRLAVERACAAIAKASQGIYVVLGHPEWEQKGCYNAASVYFNGRRIACAKKQFLPNYAVFDEKRYFIEGNEACVFDFYDIRLGLLICEDLWHESTVQAIKAKKADFLLSIHASPYEMGKEEKRKQWVSHLAKKNQIGIAYLNQIGGQDELLFDGASFVLDKTGKCVSDAPSAREALLCFDLDKMGNPHALSPLVSPVASVKQRYDLLVLALRDYVKKNGFEKVVLGLSGGIDSGLVLCIATDALGPDSVLPVFMPSKFTSNMSEEDAKQLVAALGLSWQVVSIEPCVASVHASLDTLLHARGELTNKNIQARVRGLLLMSLSNEWNALLLSTSNKSELAVGYATLYGDMVGAFDVLKDIYKTEVFALANYRNQCAHVIPDRMIERPPSAELAFDQVDEADLPPYAILDQILFQRIEEKKSQIEIEAMNIASPEVIQKVLSLLSRSEFKRRQAPMGPKMSVCGFGKDWRMPVTKQ